MRNKNLIISLVIIFTTISIYYITFTVININIQKEANKIATINGVINLSKKQEYLDSILNKPVKKILWKDFTYEEIKNKSLNFGLDLQGGTSIVIDIDIDEIIRQSCNNEFKTTINDIINNIDQNDKLNTNTYVNKIKSSLKENGSNSFITCFENTKNGIDKNSKDSDVEKFLIEKINNSIKKTHEVIQSRLDKYGVSQTNIQKLKGNRKLQIEIPGTNNQKNIKKLLEGIGELKFYEVYDSKEITELIDTLNKIIEKKSLKDKNNNIIKLNADMTYDSNIIDDVINVFKDNEIKELIPNNMFICKYKSSFKKSKSDKNKENLYLLRGDKNGNEFLNGDVITDARQTLDNKGKVSIYIKMNAIGKKIWAELTGNNIDKPIAATFDGEIIMMGNVMQKITDGITQISGDYTTEEAMTLATTLKTGSLPVPIKIVTEVIVGPSLSENIQKQGLKSVLYSIITIFLFMIIFYSRSGLISNIALIFNFLFIIGIFAQIGAVLTLPGIAGLILTLGMAIDANIIINERIKEEIKLGKNIKKAIKEGYSRSISSIVDSNITTLLTGIILYTFCSGPIKGFSITLIIGIICSLFTSIIFTKYIYYRKEQSKKLKNIKFSWFDIKNDKKTNIYNFTKFRYICYFISITIITAGIISLYKSKGFKYGIEFTSGNSFIVKLNNKIDTSELSTNLRNYLKKDVSVKSYKDDNVINITTTFDENDTEAVNKKISQAINAVTGFKNITEANGTDKTFEIISNESIEPTMSTDIKNNTLKATLIAILVIFMYIGFRFKNWKYGLAALITLLHDIIFIIAIYGILKIFRYEIDVNQIFIAAILTILGYSINNTVIIFDRLREITKEDSSQENDTANNINNAVTKTLTRTLMTSISTIMTVFIIFICGGTALHDFSLILLIGFIIGTYSSIFLSTPILKDLRIKK